MALPATSAFPQNGSIVSRWDLTESSGTRSDSAGSNNLTDNNTVTSGTGPYSDTCADFELDNTEYLSIADNASLSITGDLSYSVWVNLESSPGTNITYTLMSKYTSTGAQRSYVLNYVNDAGTPKIQFIVSDDGTATTTASHTTTLGTATWYHVGVSYDASAGETKIYVDGSLGSTSTSQKTSIYDGTSVFEIGRWSNLGSPFDGLMQDAILWNVELSDAEMQNAYDAYSGSSTFVPKVTFIG